MVNSHSQHKPISSEILKVYTLAFTQKLQFLVYPCAQRIILSMKLRKETAAKIAKVDEACTCQLPATPSHLPAPFVHVT